MIRNQNLLWASLLSSALFLTGCGGSAKEETKEEEVKEEASASVTDGVNAMKAMADEMQKNGGKVETVDFRTLKDMLPADADGLPRTEATGEKNGAGGFSVSMAKGEYANADKSETVEVSIMDGGGAAITMGLAAWSMMEVDKETENGYEKTSKLGDYKSYEKYDKSGKTGEIAVLVGNRYVVAAKGQGVDMDKLKATLEDINLSKLADLK